MKKYQYMHPDFPNGIWVFANDMNSANRAAKKELKRIGISRPCLLVFEDCIGLDDVCRNSAFQRAERATLKFGIPQTVYRNNDSGGWSHTNPMAKFLVSAEKFVTILPANYFS